MDKTTRVVVYVPQELHKRLKQRLSQRGLTVSSWFRLQIGLLFDIQSFNKEKPMKVVVHDPPVSTDAKCATFLCTEKANAMGKRYNTDSGEWSDVPMCKAHALASIKEFSK